MRELLILVIHLLVTAAKLVRAGGVRAVAAESLRLKHQLLISNRSRQRAPNLSALDRFVLGLTTLFVHRHRIAKLGVLVKPATLFKFHKALVDRKYRQLFSSRCRRRKPGPKGPSPELVAAIVEMKRRNPHFGCMRIAQQVTHAFGIAVDRDVVRRVLAQHFQPGDRGAAGPSWLTLFAHAKDSLWSVDLFCCESILLRSHWVMVVMDVFTRRVIASASNPHQPTVSRYAGCSTAPSLGSYRRSASALTTTHCFAHPWLANLRVLDIDELKSVPHAPVSHPFVERLIGTIRREYLDRVFFWNAADLLRKLDEFDYYNAARVHRGIGGITPAERAGRPCLAPSTLAHYGWQHHCRGMFQIPIAA